MPNLPGRYLWFSTAIPPAVAAKRFFIRLGYMPREIVCREKPQGDVPEGMTMRVDPNAPAVMCVGPVEEKDAS